LIPNPESCLFITGASGGLGLALARHYLEQGAVVGAVARRAELLQSLSEKYPEQVYCYPLDVRDAAAMQTAAQDFIARAGVPDIVITVDPSVKTIMHRV
jgi:NADP-dependent 3-hydroxy acid dehydrogenase YdfG